MSLHIFTLLASTSEREITRSKKSIRLISILEKQSNNINEINQHLFPLTSSVFLACLQLVQFFMTRYCTQDSKEVNKQQNTRLT